jgi:hypothetical protein
MKCTAFTGVGGFWIFSGSAGKPPPDRLAPARLSDHADHRVRPVIVDQFAAGVVHRDGTNVVISKPYGAFDNGLLAVN